MGISNIGVSGIMEHRNNGIFRIFHDAVVPEIRNIGLSRYSNRISEYRESWVIFQKSYINKKGREVSVFWPYSRKRCSLFMAGLP